MFFQIRLHEARKSLLKIRILMKISANVDTLSTSNLGLQI
jgi:hypothetical protein